jgi:predicted  nucleic acid-binding Zn-ribbon protein
VTHPILALQAADTRADQLRHRRQNLPEQSAVDASRAQYVKWQQRREGLERRLTELEAEIGRAEAESHEIDGHRARLERQLKTIIAPREAEALMHEIALLTERRGALDDAELVALEEQAQIDDDLTGQLADGEALAEAVAAAEDAAAAAAAEIDAQLAEIAAGHDASRAAVDDSLLRRYDQLRQHHMVAAAALAGTRCEGCHLDLSAAELDEVRAAASSDGLGECPHCGRMLVL